MNWSRRCRRCPNIVGDSARWHALCPSPALAPAVDGVTERLFGIEPLRPIGEIEALRDEFGAQRLVYGSWYSRYALGPMLFYLHHTNLSEAELALVCAGNLERILDSVKLPWISMFVR